MWDVIGLTLMVVATGIAGGYGTWYFRKAQRLAIAERDAISRTLINERGSALFKVARINVDLDNLQARMRGEIYVGLTIEASVFQGHGSFMVYSDRKLEDAEANAVMEMLPKAERV